MTKKSHQKFWRMKIENFFGKKRNWENFPQSLTNFPKQRGQSETGGNASLPQGDGHPSL